MSAFKRKKCKKSIYFGEISNKKSTPDYTAASSSKIKILENVQICPPLANNDSDSDYEIFDAPKKKMMNLSTLEHTQLSNENNIYISPCTGKRFSVLQNTISSPKSSNNNTTLLMTNTTPTIPTDPMTPTRRFCGTVSRNHSGLSTPSSCTQMLTETSNTNAKASPASLNALCTSSRCSSLNNISCSNLLPLEFYESSMQKLIKTTIKERRTTGNTNNSPFSFEYTFEDDALTYDEKAERKTSKCNLNNNSQKHLEERNTEKQQENNIIGQEKDQNKQNRSLEIQNEKVEELDQDVENEKIQEDAPETQTDEATNTEIEEIVSNGSDDDTGENLSSDIISEDEDNMSENISESEGGELEGDKDWIDIPDNDVLSFDESILDSVTNVPIRNKLPVDIYSLFLTDDIIDKIVEETNKYADKYLLEKEITAKSRSKAWKPTDANEMRQFFSVILTMGLNKVPHFHDYWSKKSIYRNEYICSLMGRDRFILLLKFWHFSDERNDTEDRLYKIRQILNMLNNRFRHILTPGKFIVIDESMIPWRGRLIFRQYIKNKSHKYGVKLYKLCTPEGYTFKTIVYTGKEGNSREVNHGKNVVMKLIEGLENEGRVLVADNFYSSLDLVEELLEKKTFYCGTLRSNRRGLPKQFMSKKLRKGEVEGLMLPSGVKVIKWHDKRQVSMITSCKAHKASLVDTGKIHKRTNEMIRKPLCILTYNDNKKGIDYSDQMSAYYTTLRRGLKWYRKVMMEFLFGTALINAWIIYNANTDKKMSKEEFTESIIETFGGRKISGTGMINLLLHKLLFVIQLV